MKISEYIFICVAIGASFIYNWKENQESKEALKAYEDQRKKIIALDSLVSLQELNYRNSLDSIRKENKARTDSLFTELKQVQREEWRLENDIRDLTRELEPLPEL
jgi:hypothetical protein